MEQSTQALGAHAEDSEVHENSKEAVMASDKDVQVEREASEGNNDTGDDNIVENDLIVAAEEPNEVAEAVYDIMDEPTQAFNMPVVANRTELSARSLKSAEIAADIMEQPTQALSVYAEVVTDIMEEPAQALHTPAEVIADVMDQPTQALSIVDLRDQSTKGLNVHTKESEVVDNSKGSAVASVENVQVESCLEGEMDSENDVLIDDDDASDALLDEDSPQKKKRDAETDENAVAVTTEPRTRKYIGFETRLESNINKAGGVAFPMQDQRHKSATTAQVDSTSSDSSSITEVDQAARARPKNATSSVGGSKIHVPKNIAVGETSEAEPRTEADGTAHSKSSTKKVEKGDNHEKSVDVAPDVEVMSDSSSITEVNEDISANKMTSIEENASLNPQKSVDGATSEAMSAHVDGSSRAPSISEPTVVSPRRELVSVSCDVKTAQETPDKPKALVAVASKIDTAEEIAVEDEGVASQSFVTRVATSHSPDNLITEVKGGATGSTATQHAQQEMNSSSPDAEVASLPLSQEVKGATAALSVDSPVDGKEAKDDGLVEAMTAPSTRSPDSSSAPDAREVGEKCAPEIETPRRTRSRKAQNTPRRQKKGDSTTISTPIRSPDSSSAPDAREVGEKGAPEIETPRRTCSRKAHNTPRRQKKGDSTTISTPIREDEKKRAREDYSLRGSTRKRSRAAVGSPPSAADTVRVIITGFDVTAHHKKVRSIHPLLLPFFVCSSSHGLLTAFSDAGVLWWRTLGKHRRCCVGHTRDCGGRRNVSTPHTQTHDWCLPNKQDCPHELVDPIGKGTRSTAVQ
jgi:hypothetical protein